MIKQIAIKFNGRDSDRDFVKFLTKLTDNGKEYHIFCQGQGIVERIKRLITAGELPRERLIICTLRVRTVVNKREQEEIVKTYHTGKTNHRGLWETPSSLKQKYYWINMSETIRQVLDKCEICNRVKYARKPHQIPYVLTENPDKPFYRIALDVFHYQKHKFLTAIDLFSRLAFVYLIMTKSAVEIREGVCTLFSLLGVPNMVQLDNGKEFKNMEFINVLNEMGCEIYFVTVGHHRSQGHIERFHSTLIEHIQLIQEERNLSIEEAAVRATLAYIHSIHRVSDLLKYFMGTRNVGDERKTRRVR
jgi:hypothetical protein